jgi:hypothetical protein
MQLTETTQNLLNEIFAAFPGRFRFTSGVRTPAQNAAANGAPNSYHLTGQAADFVAIDGRYPAGEKAQIGAIAARYGYEVIFHNAGSGLHYHIEPAPNSAASPNPSMPALGSITPGMIVAGLLVLLLVVD